MAEHKEKLVVDAFLSAITGLATAGNNVAFERQFDWPSTTTHAVEVEQGPDDPLADGDQSWPFVYSVTTLLLTLIYKGSASAARADLAKMRAEINIALMSYHALNTNPLGLGFVADIRESGATAVETDENDKTESRRTVQWTIKYSRNEADPTA